ncbi:MAG: hypothetical protein U0802_18630 [Candidatus Binatia bacterium]
MAGAVAPPQPTIRDIEDELVEGDPVRGDERPGGHRSSGESSRQISDHSQDVDGARRLLANRMKAAKSRRRVRAVPPASGAASPLADEVQLPTERAFLLELVDGPAPSVAAFAGRLEHLSSGTRLRFATWEAFQAAVAELLGERE